MGTDAVQVTKLLAMTRIGMKALKYGALALIVFVAANRTTPATAQEALPQEWQDMLLCMAPTYINGVHFTVTLPHFQATDRVKDYDAFAAKFIECKKQIIAKRPKSEPAPGKK